MVHLQGSGAMLQGEGKITLPTKNQSKADFVRELLVNLLVMGNVPLLLQGCQSLKISPTNSSLWKEYKGL